MDMQFNTTKRWHKKFKPRVHVRKPKEEKTREENKNMTRSCRVEGRRCRVEILRCK